MKIYLTIDHSLPYKFQDMQDKTRQYSVLFHLKHKIVLEEMNMAHKKHKNSDKIAF